MPLLKFHISRKSNRSKLDTRGTGNTTLDIQATAAHAVAPKPGPCMLECVALVRFARGCAQRARFFLRAHANETNAQAAGDTPMQQTNAQAAGDTPVQRGTSALINISNRQAATVASVSGALDCSFPFSTPRPEGPKMVASQRTFPTTEAGSSGASAASALSVASAASGASKMQVRLLV